MQIDMTINLSTVVTGAGMIATLVACYYGLASRVSRIESAHTIQHETLVKELDDIKTRLGCTEEDVEGQKTSAYSIIERVAKLESDVTWLKERK